MLLCDVYARIAQKEVEEWDTNLDIRCTSSSNAIQMQISYPLSASQPKDAYYSLQTNEVTM